MAAAQGSEGSSSDGTCADIRKPLRMSELTVHDVTSFVHESSKVLYQGYICRREWFRDTDEDQWQYYWAVVRAGHLFLFRNGNDSTVCQDAILLCRFYFENAEKCKWPKGMVYCRLRARCDATVPITDLELGWSLHYRWERLLLGHVSSRFESPRSTEEPLRLYRHLMVGLSSQRQQQQHLVEDGAEGISNHGYGGNNYESDQPDDMPMPKRRSKLPTMLGVFNRRSRADKAKNDYVGGAAATSAPGAAATATAAAARPESEEVEVYDNIGAVYDTANETPNEPAADAEYLEPTEQPPLPPPIQKSTLPAPIQPTSLMLQELQQRQSSNDDDAGQKSQQPAVAAVVAEILAASRPMEASVAYFRPAYSAERPAEAARGQLDNTPKGTFSLHGYLVNNPKKLFTLLVQTGQSVVTHRICEQNDGYKIMSTNSVHGTLNQLLYYYHIFDLPSGTSDGTSNLRLARPVGLQGNYNFLCAAVWTLGDGHLCKSFLTGTPSGTYAVLANAGGRNISLYIVSQDGQVSALSLENSKGKIWLEEANKFDSLESLLLHYHREGPTQVKVDGAQRLVSLVTPWQLSKQCDSQLQRYVSQQAEEVTSGLDDEGGNADSGHATVVVDIKRLGCVSVRTETPLEGEELPPTLQVVGTNRRCMYKGPIDVELSQFRCFRQRICTVRGNPEISFDGMDKLMLYVSSNPSALTLQGGQ